MANTEDFMAKLAAAQKLCSPDMDKKMNKIAKANSGVPSMGDDVDPSQYDGDADNWDRMFLSDAAIAPGSAKPKSNAAPVITQHSASKSRVPDFIKKSMISENIDTSALSGNPLDALDLSQLQQVKESKMVENTVPVQPAAPVSIDYPLIRAIINECIDNKFKELGLTKESLNESTLKTIHLKGGNIKLVDNSGNVYAAQLEKKGNINDRK